MPTTTLTADGLTYHIPLLGNSFNFLEWEQEIKNISQRHGVWTLINDEEVILEKPEQTAEGAPIAER